MNLKEIKELVEYLIEKDVADFELERGDVKLRVRRNLPGNTPQVQYVAAPGYAPAQAVSAPVAPQSAPPARAAEAAPAEDANLHTVKSPIVGTFYESPSPGSPPFSKPGDSVSAGQVLCIIEAMKLMNEIESDAQGEIVKCLVVNGQPVEYGQALFLIRTR